MIAIAHFAGLVFTTIFAAAAAVLLDWLLLRAMFQLMRPATAKAMSVGQRRPPQKAASTGTSEGIRVRKECCDERTEAVAGDSGHRVVW